jgi:hypothetical protein
MSHAWDFGYLDEDSWHGKEQGRGGIIAPGTTVETGLQLSRIRDVEWFKIPLVAQSVTGIPVQVDGQYMLERSPRPWIPGDEHHILGSRVVGEDFQVVQGSDLARLTQNIAKHTGWQFKGAAHLRNSEVAFVQLSIDKTFRVAGKEHEAHKAKFFFGDDKAGGSTFGGITYTRIQCYNTWRAALSSEGVWTMRHDDSPVDRMEFLAAQVVNAYHAMEEEERWLNAFFNRAMPENLFERFVWDVFPDPRVTKSMEQGEEALVMQQSGQTNGFDLSKVIEAGERSREAYEKRRDLAGRRRRHMENAYVDHNRNFADSSDTFYASAQALTHTTSHGPFRDTSDRGAMFGVRAGFNTAGMNWLKNEFDDEGLDE